MRTGATAERIVLTLLARGSTAASIGLQLRVSPRTVHKHQEHLYRKLGAVDRLSAVLLAQEAGLLPGPGPRSGAETQEFTHPSSRPISETVSSPKSASER